MSGMGRRSLLKGAGAVAAVRALAPRPAASQPSTTGPFRWGVASFDPTTSGVIIWTRVDPDLADDVEVEWSVAVDPGLTEVVAAGTVPVGPHRDGCVAVEVSDLPAGGIWWYGFATPDGAVSPIGRTRTVPEDPTRLRLALVSCSRFAAGEFGVYQALSEREVDLVVHVGDYIYEDGSAGAREHVPARRVVTLDDYRARYAQHRSDPALQALHARHPMVSVWDDHEVADNAWREGANGHDEDADGPWHDRLVAAGRAHDEWLPGRTELADDGRLRAWRSLSLGSLAELVVLDTRNWDRDPQPINAEEIASGRYRDRPRSMLGPDQQQFAADRLTSGGGARWRLVANQVMFHPLAIPLPTPTIARAVQAGGFVVVDDAAYNPDQWDGYQTARAELVEAMGNEGGVVVLSGDVHSSWAWEGPAVHEGEPVMVEVVAPSVTSTTVAERLDLPAGLIEAGLRLAEPDLAHVELSSHGYVVVDLTSEEMHAEWWYVDPASPGSARLGAARRAPRQPPMRFTTVEEPRPDPEPTTTSTTSPPTATDRPDSRGDGDDGDPAPLVVGAGVALTAVVAAAVAVRRRQG